MREEQIKHKLLKFGVLFVALCSIFIIIVLLFSRLFEPINEYTAKSVGILLNLIGLRSEVDGILISVDGHSLKIVHECSAIPLFILFSSFVLAYPSDFGSKMIGLAFGLPCLFLVNTFRLFFLSLIYVYRPEIFDYAHTYLWQIIILIMVFIACLAWLDLVVMVRTKDTPVAFLGRFVAFSSIPFLIWLSLNKSYGVIILKIAEFVLNCAGYMIEIVPDPSVSVYTATFNIVAFIALILASKSISNEKKIKAMLIGLPVIMVGHIVFSVFEVLSSFQAQQQAFQIMLTTQLVGQYFLPFGLWLAFTHKDVFKTAGACVCPICGKEVVGIEEHVRKKHGKKALKRPEVKALIESEAQKTSSISEMRNKLDDALERIRRIKEIKDVIKKRGKKR